MRACLENFLGIYPLPPGRSQRPGGGKPFPDFRLRLQVKWCYIFPTCRKSMFWFAVRDGIYKFV